MSRDSQPAAEYGAVFGTYSEWDDGDLAASQAQTVSMNAQKRYNAQPNIGTTNGNWTELTDEHRNIMIALELKKISPEDAARAIGNIASRSC